MTGTSVEAVEKAYEVLTQLSPDFVNIHNGFHFNLDRMSTHAALSTKVAYTFEETNLGNSRTSIYWRIPDGVMIVDSIYQDHGHKPVRNDCQGL